LYKNKGKRVMIKLFVYLVTIFLFTGCIGGLNKGGYYSRYDAPLVEDCQSEIRASEAIYKSTMKPYKVRGKWYYPIPAVEGETFIGKASRYGPNFHGRLTSNGERYNIHKRTAAHKTLPINTYVRVINLNNGRETIVRINDRGPFVDGRIIDLSYQAAKEIGLIKKGVVPVKLEVLSCDESANRYAQNRYIKPQSYKNRSTNASKNRYFVQIASLYNKSKAIKLKSKYASIDKKYRSYLVAKNEKNIKVYKLLIGRFASKEDAKNFIKIKNFKNAFIVKD
jgi:rare lipoprotein A